MARISDRLVIQLVDDRIVFLDDESRAEVVVTRDQFDIMDQGFRIQIEQRIHVWKIPNDWDDPVDTVAIFHHESVMAYEAFKYLRGYVV